MLKKILGGIVVAIILVIVAMLIVHFALGINIPYWPFTTF